MSNSESLATSSLDMLGKPFDQELNEKIWKTRGARFIASERLKSKAKLSTVSIAMLSIYVIVTALVGVFFDPPILSGAIIGFATTVMSIFILVFSLVEYASRYELRADSYHRCGLKLGRLYNDLHLLSAKSDIDQQALNTIEAKYASVLEQFDNHEPIDYELFQASNQNKFNLKMSRVMWIKLRGYVHTKLLYHIVIAAPPLLLGLYLLLR